MFSYVTKQLFILAFIPPFTRQKHLFSYTVKETRISLVLTRGKDGQVIVYLKFLVRILGETRRGLISLYCQQASFTPQRKFQNRTVRPK